MVESEQLIEQIAELKERRNAVLLVHNYQRPELQDIADHLGDSLGLSRTAAGTDADVIVFCGVHFMAESASILCPDKTVLIPDPASGCPMADMITADQLRALKRQHPDATVVCYVNSSAEVKAESDLCCTSANASSIVGSVPADREIIFVPDRYLGTYTGAQTGREMILWDGYCPVHVGITAEDIQRARSEHPGAVVVVHPECTPEVTCLADAVESTSGMVRFAAQTGADCVIVGTEVGMLHRLRKENPGKTFVPASKSAVCEDMKRHTLQSVVASLREMKHVVDVPPDVRDRARRAIEAMVG